MKELKKINQSINQSNGGLVQNGIPLVNIYAKSKRKSSLE